MPPYATAADFADVSDLAPPANIDVILERASRDVDRLLGARPIIIDGAFAGMKVDPTTLEPWEAAALARATAAQAEHRIVAGEAAIRGVGNAPIKSIAGPDFTKTYAGTSADVRRFGPKVRQEIEPIAHLRVLTGRAAPGEYAG